MNHRVAQGHRGRCPVLVRLCGLLSLQGVVAREFCAPLI